MLNSRQNPTGRNGTSSSGKGINVSTLKRRLRSRIRDRAISSYAIGITCCNVQFARGVSIDFNRINSNIEKQAPWHVGPAGNLLLVSKTTTFVSYVVVAERTSAFPTDTHGSPRKFLRFHILVLHKNPPRQRISVDVCHQLTVIVPYFF